MRISRPKKAIFMSHGARERTVTKNQEAHPGKRASAWRDFKIGGGTDGRSRHGGEVFPATRAAREPAFTPSERHSRLSHPRHDFFCERPSRHPSDRSGDSDDKPRARGLRGERRLANGASAALAEPEVAARNRPRD